MQVPVGAIVLCGWIGLALALGWFMGRRGFEPYAWTLIGVVFGPIAVIVAVSMLVRPPVHEPKLLRWATPRSGSVDVLVGSDGSPESRAVADVVEALLADRIGRMTIARVVPIDAGAEELRTAERDLDVECQRTRRTSGVLLRGNPAEALRLYATRLGYEVVAAGTRGHGRAPLGSVAVALARGSDVPVLLCSAPSATGHPAGQASDVTFGPATTDPRPHH